MQSSPWQELWLSQLQTPWCALRNISMFITKVSQNPKENTFFLSKDYLVTYLYEMQAQICVDIFHHTYMYVLDKIQHVFNRQQQMVCTWTVREKDLEVSPVHQSSLRGKASQPPHQISGLCQRCLEFSKFVKTITSTS